MNIGLGSPEMEIHEFHPQQIHETTRGPAPNCSLKTRLWHPHEYEKLELYGWAFPVTWEMGTLTAGWDGDGF